VVRFHRSGKHNLTSGFFFPLGIGIRAILSSSSVSTSPLCFITPTGPRSYKSVTFISNGYVQTQLATNAPSLCFPFPYHKNFFFLFPLLLFFPFRSNPPWISITTSPTVAVGLPRGIECAPQRFRQHVLSTPLPFGPFLPSTHTSFFFTQEGFLLFRAEPLLSQIFAFAAPSTTYVTSLGPPSGFSIIPVSFFSALFDLI